MGKKRGFTLVEILISVILIGMVIAGLMEANIGFTRANGVGINLSKAEFLIEQIREFSLLLETVDPESSSATFGAEEASLTDYDDIDDFDGKTFNPPIDTQRQRLNYLSAFSQEITVENVAASNLEQVVADHGSNFIRMTVKINLNGQEISSASWIRARY